MNLSKKKIAIYNVLRVSFVVTYIIYASLYVGTSLGRWKITYGVLATLDTLSLILYIVDFIIVIVMLVRLLRSRFPATEYIGKAVCVILGVNLLIKIIMLLIWLNLVVIYSFELDFVYFVLEACFVFVTIILLRERNNT